MQQDNMSAIVGLHIFCSFSPFPFSVIKIHCLLPNKPYIKLLGGRDIKVYICYMRVGASACSPFLLCFSCIPFIEWKPWKLHNPSPLKAFHTVG